MLNTENNILLSICIPTRGRNEILKNTLTSIFNSDVARFVYEVVIYDSSDDDNSADILKAFPYNNLTYKRGENKGFLNPIQALKMGKGQFLKLQNDYCKFNKDGLRDMINLIRMSLTNKPLLFFPNKSLKKIQVKECPTFDNFLYNVTFYSSWSSAFGIWKNDFEQLQDTNINPMFPHTSLLFALTNKQSYLIDNNELFDTQEVNKKGGYDLFETFAVIYLQMLEDCLNKKQITAATFKHIKYDMLKNFFSLWYCNTKILKNQYTFTSAQIKTSMNVYYSNLYYYSMFPLAYAHALKQALKNWIKK